jgi:hypothetical protein
MLAHGGPLVARSDSRASRFGRFRVWIRGDSFADSLPASIGDSDSKRHASLR